MNQQVTIPAWQNGDVLTLTDKSDKQLGHGVLESFNPALGATTYRFDTGPVTIEGEHLVVLAGKKFLVKPMLVQPW